MCALIKLVCIALPLFILSSCSNSEEPDYPAVASSISNDILIDILDSEGNNLIENESVIRDLSFVDKDGYKKPFHVVNIGDNRYIRTVFPLPMESSMSYSDDRKNGYGESILTVSVQGLKFNLEGKFQYTCTHPDKEMFGGNGIKITEIHCDDSKISVVEYAYCLKVTIKLD